MYSVVLMVAMTGGVDAQAGLFSHDCCGSSCSGCCGVVVSCSGCCGTSCCGSSCHGGLLTKLQGALSSFHHHSCCGSSCCGSSCHGCCGSSIVISHGCCGSSCCGESCCGCCGSSCHGGLLTKLKSTLSSFHHHSCCGSSCHGCCGTSCCGASCCGASCSGCGVSFPGCGEVIVPSAPIEAAPIESAPIAPSIEAAPIVPSAPIMPIAPTPPVIEKKEPEKKEPEKKTEPEKKEKDKKGTAPDDTLSSLVAPATIIVTLPADARLLVDGAATKSKSARRVFVSPALEKGRQFRYTLQAEFVSNGRPVVVSKDVSVLAGSTVEVSLVASDLAGVASR
jgi:uncharacterized protein (TIGR03000 family)